MVVPARSSSTAVHNPRSNSGEPETCPGERPASFHACLHTCRHAWKRFRQRFGSAAESFPELSRKDFPSLKALFALPILDATNARLKIFFLKFDHCDQVDDSPPAPV
eukprot:8023424-Pyramimonas_sp.AAC.1